MIPLSHPLVQDYLRVAREHPGDETLPRILLWDRLQESPEDGGGGFPAPGTPGGLDLPTVCWWYAKGSDEDEPALRTVLAVVDEMVNNGGRIDVWSAEFKRRDRPTLVRGMSEDKRIFQYFLSRDIERSTELHYTGSWRLADSNPAQQAASKCAKAVVLRDLRRRVLELYPEVEVTVRCEVSQYQYARLPTPMDEPVVALFWDNGFRLDLDTRERQSRRPIHRTEDRENRRWVYTQTLTAPDLIPPDPEAQQAERGRRMFSHMFSRGLTLPTSDSG